MKLNGWERIGVIVSVIWILAAVFIDLSSKQSAADFHYNVAMDACTVENMRECMAQAQKEKAFLLEYRAADMANMGMYRDAKGNKVIDTDTADAVVKAIGFQPNAVKRVQDAAGEAVRIIGVNKITESAIADRWAQGVFEKNPDKIQAARDDLAAWNADNPDSPIRINFVQIASRVKKMNETKAERVAKTAPKEIRESVRQELANAR